MDSIIKRITGCTYFELGTRLPESADKNRALHAFDEIINETLSSATSVENPFLMNISGIPGSGKSTWCRRIMSRSANIVYISFDEIMNDERLPYRYAEKENPQKAFDEWELPARVAGYELLKQVVKLKKNILLEHSSSLKEHLQLFEWLLKDGYKVHFRYIPVSIADAKKRVMERAEKYGRMVPVGYIEDRYKRLNDLLEAYKGLCTTYKVL